MPYLDALGVSHVYASSYLKARAGSAHGYDIVDHGSFNPEIGDEEAFDAFVAELAAHGMGHILDFVPNHMGIGRADNAWWLDVLEWGQASAHAGFFDIEWDPPDSDLSGKVLVPVLGDHYGAVLERGDLRLAFEPERGGFAVWYFEHKLPICPASFARLLEPAAAPMRDRRPPDDLAAIELERLVRCFAILHRRVRSITRRRATRQFGERCKRELAALVAAVPDIGAAVAEAAERLNGTPGEPDSFRALHRLLQAQNFRLVFWRVASDEINYRRFFQINELAGIKMELPEVFDATHRLVLRLVAAGKLQGLRIDHIDGLFDPAAYLTHLRRCVGKGAYVVVEKILAPHERLRADWPIAGTTGYDFLNLLNGLFVESGSEAWLDRVYRRFIGRAPDFADILRDSKLRVMTHELAGELSVLANELDRIAEGDWHSRDFTRNLLRRALGDVVTYFPVYRTYVTGTAGASVEDRRDIDWATAQARRHSDLIDKTVFEFIRAALTVDLGASGGGYGRRAVARFAMRFQQYTGPVMAKGLEDTSFYRYHRLVSLNEVGGDPRRMGTSVSAFHHVMRERAATWPHTMLATATHDTKRGEDVRMRIDVLSEMPVEWGRRVRRWEGLNRYRKATLDGRGAPGGNDEYLLYQMLIGAWPLELLDDAAKDPSILAEFRHRLGSCMVKSMREAKTTSSWDDPDTAYEGAVVDFIDRILDPSDRNPFLADMVAFQGRVARVAMVGGLAQTAIKLTAPGVPDIYQGNELWDLSMVDPDNRRPVDFDHRRDMLHGLHDRFSTVEPSRVRALLDHWPDGAVKMYLVWRLLSLRRERPELFLEGGYEPLATRGRLSGHLVAYCREAAGVTMTVAVPRLTARIGIPDGALPIGEIWADTAVAAPPGEAAEWVNVLTGERVRPEPRGETTVFSAGRLFANFPVCVLVGEKAAG